MKDKPMTESEPTPTDKLDTPIIRFALGCITAILVITFLRLAYLTVTGGL